MSRYIDAEWLKERIEVISYEGMWHTTETDEFVAVDNINQAPSIDICFCRECKWSKPNRYGDLDCTCHVPTFRTIPQGYCWRGERKDGE